MNEESMPAAEAVETEEREDALYEIAFHILPTVAEEEVARVFEELKALAGAEGGEVVDAEVPRRFNLAYDIIKRVDGARQRFATSYFGWVRAHLSGAAVAALSTAIGARSDVLRCMVVTLTREDEAEPFRVFESRPLTVPAAGKEGEILESKTAEEQRGEVSEEALGESLEKIVS